MVYVLNREITFPFQLPNQIFSTNDQNVPSNAIIVINALLTWNHLKYELQTFSVHQLISNITNN